MLKIVITPWLLLACSFSAAGQEKYKVGFRMVCTYDSSRIYKPNTSISDKLHFRPIEIDLWYPAEITSTDTTASFWDLLYLLEQRSNTFDDTKNHNGLTDEMLQYICAGIDCPDCKTLKKVRTESYVNAKSLAQKFPLIIYFSAFNGMSYENYLLFESLTKKGFVVACVSSIGRHPGNMTMEMEDIVEQVKDAEFIKEYLITKGIASTDIGLIGYSWGGLAATLMAMSEPNGIEAIVSLDGSEQFEYMNDKENEMLTRIRQADMFKPEAIKASYLHLDSDISETEDLPDSTYNLVDYLHGDKSYLMINQARHEDFSSLNALNGDSLRRSRYTLIQRLTISYLLDKFYGTDVFNEIVPADEVSREFSLAAIPFDSLSGEKKVLRGVVRDSKTNRPLPYVNIGIPNKDVGTASNVNGEFELTLSEASINDTLRISRIGYESKNIHLSDALRSREHNIELEEKSSELKEVVISDEKLTTKVLGNKTQSKFFGGKFASGDLGSEIAIKIKIKDAPTYLDCFSFNISYNDEDTAAFRVNVYDMRDGIPNRNLLTEEVIVRVNGQTGKFNVDLSKYNIALSDNFFIGLEWIEGRKNSGIVFSSGLVNRGTYYRKASQGRWKKYSMGVGFNVTAKY